MKNKNSWADIRISYKYFLMLAGNENFVKPDRMINRYLENII